MRELPPYVINKVTYLIFFKGLALIMMLFFVYLPIMQLVETLYKKESTTFKSKLLCLCLTAPILSSLVLNEIDYQGILYIGFTLWCHAFLAHDNITGSLICYGFVLNCSLDGILLWPFITYRVICKVLKEIYKNEGFYKK